MRFVKLIKQLFRRPIKDTKHNTAEYHKGGTTVDPIATKKFLGQKRKGQMAASYVK